MQVIEFAMDPYVQVDPYNTPTIIQIHAKFTVRFPRVETSQPDRWSFHVQKQKSHMKSLITVEGYYTNPICDFQALYLIHTGLITKQITVVSKF